MQRFTRWPHAPLPRTRHRFVVIAHRGDHTQAPENSLAALKAAIATGADYVEVDLRTTRDGHLVLMHDSTVDRTADGRGKVAEMPLDELRALTLKGSTERIPTFDEALTVARGKMRLYLDCKAMDPAQVWSELGRHRMERSVVAYDDPEGCVLWKKVAPRMPVMASPPGDAKTPDALRAWWDQFPVEVLDGPFFGYTAELSAAAKGWGAAVWPDIENPGENPAQWDDALSRGVDGLQTDFPSRLIAHLQSRHRR